MKQALLITAYKNVDQLLELIDYFPGSFEFFIHVDKKSNIDVSRLTGIPNKKTFVFQVYKVNWGGINHLKAILLLTKEALKNKDIGFFHLITGEDYPAKSVDYFLNSLDTQKSYLDFFKLTNDIWSERIDFYNLYDTFNAKDPKGSHRIQKLINLQKRFKIKRNYSKNLPPLYGGSTYWSMARKPLQHVIDYTEKDKSLFNRLKHTFCAEELYFQTILMNFASENIVRDNRRFLDWDSGRGGRPAFLDATDFPKIISSDTLFARKFHHETSSELKRMLQEHNGYKI
jgi:hypothetical protein